MTEGRRPPSRLRGWTLLLALVALVLVSTWGVVRFATSESGDDRGARPADADASSAGDATTSGAAAAARDRRRADRSRDRDDTRRVDPAVGQAVDGQVVGGVKTAVGARGVTDPSTASASVAAAVLASKADGSNATSNSAAGVGVATRADDPTHVLVVRVKSAEKDEPLSAADVQVFTAAGVTSVRTDFQGRAAFTIPTGSVVDVEAKAPGRVRARREHVAAPSPTTVLDVALERGVVVQGRVTGPKGAIGGAKVRAFVLEPWLKAPPYDPDPRAIEATTSDKRGAYRLDCIPRGVACALVAEADGYAMAQGEIEPQPDPDYVVRRDAELEPGVVVEGVVRDEKGDGVDRAAVFALDDDFVAFLDDRWNDVGLTDDERTELAMLDLIRDARDELDGGSAPRRVRSDARGAFRLVLPSSWDDARAIALHASVGRSSASSAFDPRRGRPELVVRGRVKATFDVRSPSGKPARGSTIAPYFPWERWNVSEGEPGLYGTAEMDDGPSVERVAGQVDAPGVYVGRRIDRDRLVWRVNLQPGVAVRGVVRDDRGTAVVGANVKVGERTSTTDAQGRFEILGARVRDDMIVATTPGHITTRSEITEGSRSSVEVVMPRSATARLRLKLPESAAVPSWRRVWHGSAAPSRNGAGLGTSADQFEWNDGVVEVSDLTKRDGLIVVFVPGYEVVVRVVAVKPGEEVDLNEFALVPARLVAGVVVYEYGQPMPGAEVFVRIRGTEPWREMLPQRSVDTNSLGEFRVEIVAPGEKCEIVVSAPDVATTPQSFDPRSAAPLRVLVGRERRFFGKVLDVSISRENDWFARLAGPSDETYAVVPVGTDGRFVAEVPRPPRVVEIFDRSSRKPFEPVRTTTFTSDWPEDKVLEIPK